MCCRWHNEESIMTVDRCGRSRGRQALCVGLFGLLAPCAVMQKGPTSMVRAATRVQNYSTSEVTKFTDVTSGLRLRFEYVASHTSKKYLIGTMGSGVALFDYDNDGRLDVFVVNGTLLGDPTPKGT